MLTQTSAPRGADLASVNPVLSGHILLVEDDASIRDLVVVVLEHEGYVVTASRTLVEAERLLHQGTFDLVVTDGFSKLPRAAFITTSDLVRSAGLTPVALFSAHAHDPDVVKAAGFRDLITKTFDLDTLAHQVKVLLDGSDVPTLARPVGGRMAAQTILVVDDEASMRKCVTVNLAARGYDVVTASDGTEARSHLDRGGIDLVILDFVLPAADSLDILWEARKNAGVPVILMSASLLAPETEAEPELRADAYLLKPFGVDELMACVRSVLPDGQ